MKITTKRLAPGYYEVTNGKRTVEVYRREAALVAETISTQSSAERW